MRRFNAYSLDVIGVQLKVLDAIQAGDAMEPWFVSIALSGMHLEQLLKGEPLPIRVTRQAADLLTTQLRNLLPEEPGASPPSPVEPWRIGNRQATLQSFNTIFNAELANLDTYWVEPTGIYSTSDLIENAENVFSEPIRNQLDQQTRTDINEAGKCIAFDLSTAAAFHVWRSVERELRRYFEDWTGGSAGTEDWATLLNLLRKTKADAKTLAVLDHLRALHRNPSMHPENHLTPDEAVSLFGLANSAISAMVIDKPASQLGPGSNAP